MNNLIQNVMLDGDDIPKLVAWREKGRQVFQTLGLPKAKTEAWKYTRVRDLESGDFIINRENCSHTTEHCCRSGESVLPFEAYEIKFCNGKLTHDHFHLPDNVEAMSLLDAVLNAETKEYLNKNFEMENFPFAALNTAYLEQGVFLRIRKNSRIEKPIALIYHTHGDKKIFNNIHNIIIAESGSKLSLVEYFYYQGALKSEYFNNIVNEIYVGRFAVLNYTKLQDEALKAVHIALNAVRVKNNGFFNSFCLLKGANLARHETHVALKEEGAEATVNAVYTMNGWATLDTTTDIEHFASHTKSNQLIKGVVGGQAKGVFQGKIHIAPDTVQTQGYQLHKALLLSEKAEVDVKPELEIYADDVKCSHGAASGELDKEQMFYLRSRGIGEEEARQLLIGAFIEEALESVTTDCIKKWFKASMNLVAD